MRVLLIIGLFLALVGGGGLAWLYLRRSKVSSQIAAARQWPEATAVVDVVNYEGFTAYVFGQRVARWKPVFRYRFQAGGQTFTGERIIFGVLQSDNAKPVKKLIAPYAPGQWIKVRFNPYDPRDSVVELRHPPQPRAALIVMGGMVAVGLLLTMLGAAGVGPNVGGGATSGSRR